MLLQAPRLACKNQRRKGRELLLDFGESGLIRINRDLQDRLAAPAVRRPTLGHDAILLVRRINSGKTAVLARPYTRHRRRHATANTLRRGASSRPKSLQLFGIMLFKVRSDRTLKPLAWSIISAEKSATFRDHALFGGLAAMARDRLTHGDELLGRGWVH